MTLRSFTTRIIQLNTYLPCFPPDYSGRLVTSLPDDDIRDILHHTMPNTWKKNIVEHGCNYLDGPNHSMAEFFDMRIENLEKSIPPSVPSGISNSNRKVSKKRKGVTFIDSQDEDFVQGHTGKKFCHYKGTCEHTIYQYITNKVWVKQA